MAQRLRRRVVPPLISALLCGSMVPITGAATAAAEHNAWLVIVTGATTPDGADALLEQYKTSGLPEHGDFPRVIESATIPGLKPGFWIVAAAAPNSVRVVLPFVGTAARGDLAAIPYLQGAGAGCHVHVSGKRDDETFTFDAQITTFKRIQLTCDYGGD